MLQIVQYQGFQVYKKQFTYKKIEKINKKQEKYLQIQLLSTLEEIKVNFWFFKTNIDILI